MNKSKTVKIIITSSALLVAVIHIIWPSLSIDAITLTLIIVSIIPWLEPLFKSVELPGGLKFEFQELQRVKEEAEAAGLLNNESVKIDPKYNFIELADISPQLALVSLRIELEKSLKTLAEENGLSLNRKGISFFIHQLSEKQLISSEEKSALADMIGTLNRAAHGENLDERVIQWILEVGPQVLESIKKKLDKGVGL